MRTAAAGKRRTVRRTGYVCRKCRHEWVPKSERIAPRICPKCKTQKY